MVSLYKDGLLDWEKIQGIVSDSYPLVEGCTRIHDISYKWNIDRIDEYEKIKSCSYKFLARTREFFNLIITKDIEEFRHVLGVVFEEKVNKNTFKMFCCQCKKIGLLLLNEGIITLELYKIIKNLRQDKIVEKKDTVYERNCILEEEKKSVIFTLKKFIEFMTIEHPRDIYMVEKMLLKFWLSNRGLRKSSFLSIKNKDIEQKVLRVKVFKKQTESGFEIQSYPYAFVGAEYFEMLLKLRDESRPEDFFFENKRFYKLSGYCMQFVSWMKKDKFHFKIKEGWESYQVWVKNTHSGRHGFIFECHQKGLSDIEISEITLQHPKVIADNYTKVIAKETKKAIAMAKFINAEPKKICTMSDMLQIS